MHHPHGLFDVDHFKQVNDQYGHDIGDSVLQFLSNVVRSQLRKSDITARWGGEEFIVLAPEADADTAVAIADKLRRAISTPTTDHHQPRRRPRPTQRRQRLPHQARQALYCAKQAGRNRVILEAPEPPPQPINTPQ